MGSPWGEVMRVISSPRLQQAPDQLFWTSANVGENPGRNEWHPTPCGARNEPVRLPLRSSRQSPPTLRRITESDHRPHFLDATGQGNMPGRTSGPATTTRSRRDHRHATLNSGNSSSHPSAYPFNKRRRTPADPGPPAPDTAPTLSAPGAPASVRQTALTTLCSARHITPDPAAGRSHEDHVPASRTVPPPLPRRPRRRQW